MIRLISSRPSLVVVVAHLEVSPLDSLISQSILPLNRYDKGLILSFLIRWQQPWKEAEAW